MTHQSQDKIKGNFWVRRHIVGTSYQIPEFTDTTSYEENIFGFYSTTSKSSGKTSIQIRLRAEQTNVEFAGKNGSIQPKPNYPFGRANEVQEDSIFYRKYRVDVEKTIFFER